jgi:DNA-binding transcriptional LysR family regulator
MALHFDLVDLQLLVNIAQEKSLTKGAERSRMSLPSASIRIKILEEKLGTKLLYRTKQGVTLTPAGETMLHHARIVLQQLENLHGDLHEHISGLKGHVRLFANATSISASLPGVLRTYLTSYPNVDVDLRERLSVDGVRAVADGAADIAIIAGNTNTDGLEVLPFASEELVLATATGHVLAQRGPVDFGATLAFDYIGLPEDSSIHRFLVKQAQRLHKPLSIRIQVGSFETICRMIEAGVGIGVLPASAARRYARVMALSIVPLRDDWSIRRAKICVRSLAALPVFAQKLVGMLATASQREAAIAPDFVKD